MLCFIQRVPSDIESQNFAGGRGKWCGVRVVRLLCCNKVSVQKLDCCLFM